MKTKLYYLGILFFLIFVDGEIRAQAPDWQWAKSNENPSASNPIVATDGNGDIYFAGGFENDSITFGGITLTSSGGDDIFIVKYDAAGNVLWAQSAGGIDAEFINCINTDDSGNILIAGTFLSPTISFGTTILSSVSSGMFIVKYDSWGNVLWAKNGTGIGTPYPTSMAIDNNGNILMAGDFLSTFITFGATMITNGNWGIDDMFIAKYDKWGNSLWAKSAGGSSYDGAGSVATDKNGNVLVAGTFMSSVITFGTTTLTNANTSLNDIFIGKYDSIGNGIWAMRAGGTYHDFDAHISTDSSDDVILTGTFYSPYITFGTITLNIKGNTDIFIVKYDAAGNVLWAKNEGENSTSLRAKSMVTDFSGNISLLGQLDGYSVTLGTTLLTSVGSGDLLVARYDPYGNLVWAKSAGGTNQEFGYVVAIDSVGNIIIAGTFESPSITFGNSTIISTTGIQDDNIFIAKLGNVTGYPTLSLSNNLSLFPNPATNLLHLTLTKPLPPNTTITIMDMQGRVAKEVSKITPGGDAIDVSTLTQGVYLLKVNGQVQRFVKM